MPVAVTYDDATIRYRLRLARTEVQVGTPAKDHRRRTFWAALQQFEELLDAAGNVGSASRPLPLFYALSQAGRAITAAHGSVPWELRGHGLEMPGPTGPTHLLERRIEPRPTGKDSFHRVAQTIGSDVLTAPVELGAVWASLPYDLPKAWEQRWPSTLPVESLVPRSSSVLTDEVAANVVGFAELTADAIRQLLEQYPRAQGWQLPAGSQLIGKHTPYGWMAMLVWRANGTSTEDRLARLDEVAPEYRRRGQRKLRPAVGTASTGKDYLKPLTAWWVLLYGLSMVARYEPAEWANVLAVNTSDLAAPLESLLDDAMLEIPQLVLEAIEGQPFLVS
jgi:hypothetical protein